MHWLDRVQVWALRRSHCFRDGWGDLSRVEALAEQLRNPGPPAVLDVDLSPATRVLGADLRIGTFDSPAAHLPDPVRTGRFWWLHPVDQHVRGAVVAFASWGEEGPTLRGRMIGGLVREGISVLILENPFYGVRRREGQRSTSLRTVGDFVDMQGATFDEARALVAWTSRQVDAPIAVTGFSMGGHLAATVACAAPSTLPVAVLAPPRCPSEPFTAGPLSTCIDWEALGGDTPEVHARWTAIMDLFEVIDLPLPRAPELTRIIACRDDGLVPPDHAHAIAARWRAPIEHVEVGHVGAALTQGRALRRALREVLGVPRRDARPLLTGALAQATAAVGRLRG